MTIQAQVVNQTPADPRSAADIAASQNEGHGRRLTAAFEALEAFPALAESRNRLLRVVAEEPFGPILPVLKWRDEDDVIRRANDTPYGLGASVWGQDLAAVVAIAGPEASAARHPRLPQLQGTSEPRATRTWPMSPATPCAPRSS